MRADDTDTRINCADVMKDSLRGVC
jgi:hypothetical protein